MERWEAIYDFWFGVPGSDRHGTVQEFWFGGGPETDREIRDRFAGDVDRAADGGYDSWRDSPQSCVALIVLLDQFPRNIFRGTPRSFAADPAALRTARHAIAQPWHESLETVEKLFVYLPFEHSEDLADQRRCVELFRALEAHEKKDFWIDYAIEHLEIIEQFGRFPHRNDILGRATTAAEKAWLDSTDQRFGQTVAPAEGASPADGA